jgi:hypothetical protein
MKQLVEGTSGTDHSNADAAPVRFVAIVVHGPLFPEVLYSRSTCKDPEPPLALQEIM